MAMGERKIAVRGVAGNGWWGRLMVLLLAALVVSGCAPKVQVAYHARQRPVAQQPSFDEDQPKIQLLKRHYEKWRGTPYVDGGMSPTGVDCSGYTVLAFRDLFNLALPRTALEQAGSGREIPRQGLRSGDLVFFSTGRNKRHVGIYLYDDQFIHASLSRGVTLSSLDDPYWQERYWQSRRLTSGGDIQPVKTGGLALSANVRR